MADNIDVTPGSGATFAADDIGGVLYSRVKISWGVDGAAVDASASNPFPVVQTGTLNVGTVTAVTGITNPVAATQSGTWNITNVSGTVSLPTGAATSAKQDTMITSLGTLDNVVYEEGDTADPISGVPMLWEDTGDTLKTVSASTPLPVDIISGGAGGVQYDVGDVAGATDTGTLALVVRDDALSTLGDADGDYVQLRTTSTGRLWASATIDAALPAGNNNIGDVDCIQSGTWNIGTVTTVSAVTAISNALPAGNNNIGDVDVASVVPGVGATNLGKAEDAAHTSGDVGVMALVVRNDAGTPLAADGDYIPITTDSSGAIRVTGGGGGTQYQVGDVAGATDTGTLGLLIRDDALSTLADADGDYVAGRVTSTGRLWTSATIDAALPAGTNNIGDVDVLSVIPGVGATNLGKAEDAAHTTGDTGVMPLGVRNDAGTAFGSDGDYVPLSIDSSGALRVTGGGGGTQYTEGDTDATPTGTVAMWKDAGDEIVSVSSTTPLPVEVVGTAAVTQSGTWNIGTVTTVTAVTAITNALPAGTNAIGKLSANSGVDIGDVDVTSLPALPAGTNTIGNVGLVATATGGASMHSLIATGSSGDATNVKNSAGTLYGWAFSNINAAPAYVKLYNSATAPTAGAGTPVLRLIIPGNTSGAGSNIGESSGAAFSTGIGFTIVTGAADNSSTSVAAGEVIVNFFYK